MSTQPPPEPPRPRYSFSPMSAARSPYRYEDCYAAFDAAIADPIGTRMPFYTEYAALHFRIRCHQARGIERRRNLLTYPDPAHPNHGATPYDRIVIRAPRWERDRWWLLFHKCVAIPGQIYSLATGEEVETTMPTLKTLDTPPPQNARTINHISELEVALAHMPLAPDPPDTPPTIMHHFPRGINPRRRRL